MSIVDKTGTVGSAPWVERDREVVWHGMTPYPASLNPMVVSRGEGPYITDEDGNRYLDAMSGLWCVNLGYSERALAEAAFEQMVQMPYYPLSHTHKPAIELGEKLNTWLGGRYRVFYSNSGSEANEAAFKIARQFHAQNGEPQRWKIISRYRAYHGSTMGALAATGQFQRKYKYEPLAPGFVHVPPPDCYRCPFGKQPGACRVECADMYEQVINWEIPETVAAVIIEPVITGGGMIVPPPEYLQRVREVCDRTGVLMIVDEVICGFGRSGKPFGFQNFGVQPDIVTMAKGITSGYLPLSATAVRAELFDVFRDTEEYAHFRHVNTFGGNPVACALAVRTLELMEERNLVERAAVLGARLRERLSVLAAHPNVGDLRHFGFLAGIELVEDKTTKTPASAAFVGQVIARCKQQGVLIGKNGDTVRNLNNVLTLCPPFVVTDEELDFIAQTVIEAISSARD
ncbi:aspartate aminotransferase family protein [Alicyclobacillus cycloheptanicus]|uniref:Adenosylmethionine-8-amino-7-oxononanoate aminotransferase n=1 Tax=Alicyclobacillus cycloheptanicus TaxID=1457 RepID=A0ABT9XG54_9BACL|nr:aspartate aminotransferase family protein [Alicyclobacillus cycloheptanicus]MDQ0189182.1 adenosylmethionine-8-amino-7-oxononanoate aminotransferase [Alicyclobacillus cycloheptanicus]WDM00368.1 aspartate aminotransferase family protein [Alicyclobacillus cycloheptanicus]